MSVEQVPKDQEVQKVEEGGLDATGIEEKMVMWSVKLNLSNDSYVYFSFVA